MVAGRRRLCPHGHCFDGPEVSNVHAISSDGQQAMLASGGDLALSRAEGLSQRPAKRVATGTADGMLLLWDVAEVVKP